MQTFETVKSLCADIKYSDWELRVIERDNQILIQWQWESIDLALMVAQDDSVPNAIPCAGRKWVISEFAVDAEVVQTALLALLTALEHEAREQFRYKGKAIFNPHLSLESLLARADDRVKRPPPVPLRPSTTWPFPTGDKPSRT